MKWIIWLILLAMIAGAVFISFRDNGFDKVAITGAIFLLLAVIIVTKIILFKTKRRKEI